jgi:hypothetical protein
VEVAYPHELAGIDKGSKQGGIGPEFLAQRWGEPASLDRAQDLIALSLLFGRHADRVRDQS